MGFDTGAAKAAGRRGVEPIARPGHCVRDPARRAHHRPLGENEIALPADEFASARHARIEPQVDGVWILDLGSTNGTYVNGSEIDGREQLHDGDVVRIGDTELRVTRMRIAETAGATDPGRVRRRNEDAYVCEPPLFAVADGMGGAQAGELASRLAAAALREQRDDAAPIPRRTFARASRRPIAASSRARRADPQVSGMGTTVTAAFVAEGQRRRRPRRRFARPIESGTARSSS